jgi:putative pyruvate formate lyase activating enzyme
MWEEPCISGTRGSGTVFFSGCNLRCVYCQNFQISQKCFGKELTIEQLAGIYLKLQQLGAHNINLVSPTHYTSQIRESLKLAEGLTVPIVYNSNGYENIDELKRMEGYINVYLPDIKYCDDALALKYSGASGYFDTAAQAVREMHRQVGAPVIGSDGIIKKGLIIRHLILPGFTRDSIKILDWISENLPSDVFISLMSQYTPCFSSSGFPEIDRRITRKEYDTVVNHLFKLSLENGYIQERDSADEGYIPEFNLEGL